MNTITPAALKEMLTNKNITLLDMRDSLSYTQAHIGDAIHLDINKMMEISNRLNKEEPVIIYCYHGISSLRTASVFEELGFAQVFSLEGGYAQWFDEQ